jgi:lipopolysaccharide export system permease protein
LRSFIIERYLIRETLQNFAAVMAVLLLIYMSNRFVRFLAEAAAGDLDSGVILELLVLKLTANSVLLLPLSLYIGALLALGRLYRDSEVVAMHAGGIGLGVLMRSATALGLVFVLLTGAMSMYFAPLASERAEALTRQARSDSEVTGLFPGRFKEFSDGDQIVYAQDISPSRKQLNTVFVQVRREAELDIVYARSASHLVDSATGDRFMVLNSGHRYEGAPGDADYVVHRFEEHGVRIRKRDEQSTYRRLEVLSLTELLAGRSHTHAAELLWRVSMPVSALVLVLLAVPLAKTSPRAGKYGRLFIAVLVYFIYSNLMSISQKAVERGDLSPWLGIWPVHVLMLIAVGVLLFMASGGFARRRSMIRARAAAVS